MTESAEPSAAPETTTAALPEPTDAKPLQKAGPSFDVAAAVSAATFLAPRVYGHSARRLQVDAAGPNHRLGLWLRAHKHRDIRGQVAGAVPAGVRDGEEPGQDIGPQRG